jgi:hypothetical protein
MNGLERRATFGSMVDLSRYTGTYPLTIDHAVEEQDGNLRRTGRTEHELTPGTINTSVNALTTTIQGKFGRPTCVLSFAPIGDETNVEHVLPQGLGARWVKLPKGLVLESANNNASKSEQQFLRRGLMGVFRPFYVGSKKDVSFDFADGATVTFQNHPTEGFEISIVEPKDASPRDLGLPDSAGPGMLRIDLPVDMPDPRAASVALHKLAYLTLCLVEPNVALDNALQPTRDFISGSGPYRAYAETFVPEAPPGFHACFYLVRQAKTGVVRRVVAIVRLHHVRYTVSLAGPDAVSNLKDSVPETLPAAKRNVTVGFEIGAIQRESPRR